MQAERVTSGILDQLQEDEFFGGRKAWGTYTPSTASTDILSRATSSISSGSRPNTCTSSISGSLLGNEPNVKASLRETKSRAKASFAALQSELRGSAGATPARYSSWPSGCAVRVLGNDRQSNVGSSVFDGSEPQGIIASLVRYDQDRDTFEVKLDDGSMRTVPCHQVTRVRARDRTNAPPAPQLIQLEQQEVLHLGSANSPDSHKHPQMPGLHEMSEHPFDIERTQGSTTNPEPQTLGRTQST